jgi:CBS domain-containing protein
MYVRDIMTRNPFTIDQDAPVGTAIAVMVAQKIRHLPVVDAQGTLVGLVADRDLRSVTLAPAVEPYLSAMAKRRLRGIGTAIDNLRVKEIMTHGPITVSPEMAVSQAAALMLEHHVGSLPVLDQGLLVGIVTDRDAVKALAMHMPALRYAAESLW